MSVHFDPLGKSGEAHPDETVLDVARRVGAPIANACGGVGVCNRCNIVVVSGRENLNRPTELEVTLMQRGRLSSEERLACQSVVRGECRVSTTYWGVRK